jgi:hypothetical protein
LSGLTYGYGDSANRLGGVQGQMGSGWNDAKSAYGDSNRFIDNTYKTTIGNLPQWKTPTQNMLEARKSQLTSGLMDSMMEDRMPNALSDFHKSYYGFDTRAQQVAKMRDALAFANGQLGVA